MDLKLPETRDELFNFLIKEQEDSSNLRNEMNFDIGNKRIDVIKEKRIFFQNMAITSATLVGLTSVFSSLNSKIYIPYLYTGLGSQLILICIVAVYLRYVLDSDQEGLTDQQDRYSEIIREKISLIDKYKNIVIQKSDFNKINTINIFKEYLNEIKELPSIKHLEDENRKIDEARKLRISGKKNMEFYGEVMTFTFIFGVSFIFLLLSVQGLILHI